MRESRKPRDLQSTRLKAVLVLLLMLCAWCWLEARTLASNRSSYAHLTAHVERMDADSMAIQRLREVPKLAAERERPNDDLLAEVRDALAAAKVPADRWMGNDPSPAVRLPKTPYKRPSVRLLFEGVRSKQLVAFAHEIARRDTALSIRSLRLTAPPDRRDDTWNADLVLSYLLYSPYQER